MNEKTLHITNGLVLTGYLKELNSQSDIMAWQEMLCDGPTVEYMDAEEFYNIRATFYNDFYDIEINEIEYKTEIHFLSSVAQYSEIILWFDYSLFSHINMIAVISLLSHKNVSCPLFLVCSGRVPDEKGLKSLSDLNQNQLQDYYENRIRLQPESIELAKTIWKIYCGKDHNLFLPYLAKKSQFQYLSNCLQAHLNRFPDSKSGLSVLELNILKILSKYPIHSPAHLLEYALNYQGYYGFGELQLSRIIEGLKLFFTTEDSGLKINTLGAQVLSLTQGFTQVSSNNLPLGGVIKNDYVYDATLNKLLKK